MKTTRLFFRCLNEKIKNKFFIGRNCNNDFECDQWQEMKEQVVSGQDQKGVQEYLNSYRVTTRWQTL